MTDLFLTLCPFCFSVPRTCLSVLNFLSFCPNKLQLLLDTDNISFQSFYIFLKLQQAGYIDVTKGFEGKRPKTSCKITKKGLKAFEEYVEALKGYIIGIK